MSIDRFVRWGAGKHHEWGPPDAESVAEIARDYLGETWTVELERVVQTFASRKRGKHATWITCKTSAQKVSYALASQDPTWGARQRELTATETRGFEVFFLEDNGEILQTSVITRHSDEFTSAVADGFAKVIARWWDGTVEWPT